MTEKADLFREDIIESVQAARANDVPATAILGVMLELALEIARDENEECVEEWDGLTTRLNMLTHAVVEQVFDALEPIEETDPERDPALS